MFNLDKKVNDFWKGIENSRLKDRTIYLLEQVRETSKEKKNKIRMIYQTMNNDFSEDVFYRYYTEAYKNSRLLLRLLLETYIEINAIKNDILISNELEQKQTDLFQYFLHKTDQIKKGMAQIERLFVKGFPFYYLRMVLIRKTFQHYEKPLLELKGRIATNVRVRGEPIRLNKTQRVSHVYREENTRNEIKANARVLNLSPLSPNFSPNINTQKNWNHAPMANVIQSTIANRVMTEGHRAPRAKFSVVKVGTLKNKPILLNSRSRSRSRSRLSPRLSPSPRNKETLLEILEIFSDFTKKLESKVHTLDLAKKEYSKTYKAFVGNPYGYVRETSIEKLVKRIHGFSKLVKEKQIEVKKMDLPLNAFDQILSDLEGMGKFNTGYIELTDKLQLFMEKPFSKIETNDIKTGLFEIEEYFLICWTELHESLNKKLGKYYVDIHFPMPILNEE
jgi:hypothetical protein